jgi:hypothetical protein
MSDELLGMVPPNTTGTYQQVAQLFAALAKAQGEFEPISRNREAVIRPKDQSKSAYTFAYADLAEIISATRPALAANGLSIVQPLVPRDGALTVVTMLLHEGGATMWTECEAPDRAVAELKEFGGRYNYLRRYQYQGLLCLASEDDIDSDGEGGTGAHSGGDAQNSTTASGTANGGGNATMQRKPSAPGAKIDAGSVAWINRKIKALGMDAAMIEAMFTRLQIPLKAPADLTAEEFAAVKTELTKASAL